MQTIVIDREYGSGGREVAQILSERLDIPFFDGDMLVQAAEKSHLDLSMMKDFDEKRIGSLLYNIATIASGVGSLTGGSRQLETPHKVYSALERLMRELVANQPCIFLGRCADQILNGVTPLLKVFVYSSDINEKAKRIAEIEDCTLAVAEGELHKKDMQRANYYRFFTNRAWGDRGNYDICLNSANVKYAAAASAIEALLDKK